MLGTTANAMANMKRRRSSSRRPQRLQVERRRSRPFRSRSVDPRTSRNSHERASAQSRSTVRRDTFSTAAVSSTSRPPKYWELDNLTPSRVDGFERHERGIQLFQIGIVASRRHVAVVHELDRRRPATPFAEALRARQIDEDAPHESCRQGVEVCPVVPLHLTDIDQPQIQFVDQRGRLQGVVTALAQHGSPGQAAELAVHERDQLLERPLVAVAPGGQQSGHVLSSRRSVVGH